MKKTLIAALMLSLVACKQPTPLSLADCGEGSYGISSGDKHFTLTRECVLTHWESCTEAIGTLTTFTVEGDPIKDSYHILPRGDECQVNVVHDASQDAFGGGITESTCTSLELQVEETTIPLLITDDCI